MRLQVWAVALVPLALTGCAGFRAVGAFGTETQNMAATVQAEMSTLQSICTRIAACMVAVFKKDDFGAAWWRVRRRARGAEHRGER
jgi:hypothetical protein